MTKRHAAVARHSANGVNFSTIRSLISMPDFDDLLSAGLAYGGRVSEYDDAMRRRRDIAHYFDIAP